MKTTNLFLAILFFLITGNIKSFAQTTMEEYNYLTIGYKDKLLKGDDMKKGYSLENVNEKTLKGRTATLNRFKKGKSTVAFMIAYQKGNGKVEYICIPQPNSNELIKKKFINSLHNGDADSSNKLQLITLLLSNNLF